MFEIRSAAYFGRVVPGVSISIPFNLFPTLFSSAIEGFVDADLARGDFRPSVAEHLAHPIA